MLISYYLTMVDIGVSTIKNIINTIKYDFNGVPDYDKNNTYSNFYHNLNKNNSNNSKVPDKTRVIIKKKKKLNADIPHTDYINANYIYDNSTIISQYPLNNTLEDFLSMCYYDNVNIIINLCNLSFTSDKKKNVGIFNIKSKIICESSKFCISTLEIQKVSNRSEYLINNLINRRESDTVSILDHILHSDTLSNEEERIHYIYSIQYKNCLLIPREDEFKELFNNYREFINNCNENIKTCIMCYNGINNSGLFAFINILLKDINKDPIEILKSIRSDRDYLVINKTQFNFAIEFAKKIQSEE